LPEMSSLSNDQRRRLDLPYNYTAQWFACLPLNLKSAGSNPAEAEREDENR